MSATDTTLEAALAALRSAGAAAGVSAREVDDEAAAYAASICADDATAVPAWAAGFDRPASAFGAAAARGRAWRGGPTPILARLACDGENADAARYYAGALVDFAAATATITAPSLERINAAGFAA